MQVIQNDVMKCCKMMSSNVVLLHSNNCCVVLEPAICEDLDLHVAIFTSSGHQWRPVKTSSYSHPRPGRDTWWLLKELRSAQAGGTHPTGMLSC